ncbi:MAG: hypothetical protein ABI604_16610 [Nitrospirota bacterium]
MALSLLAAGQDVDGSGGLEQTTLAIWFILGRISPLDQMRMLRAGAMVLV